MILQTKQSSLSDPEQRALAAALPNPIQGAAVSRPHHDALEFCGQTWTGLELLSAVTRAAGRMHQAGVGPGRVVALMGPPSPEWVTSLHAAGWLGAAVAPLPPSATRSELATALDACRCDHVFLTDGLDPSQGAAIRGLAPEAAFVDQLEPGSAPPERFWPLDEVRLILLTSGSTGAPKAVRLTTAQLLYSAFGSAIRLGHDPQDRWLACLPLSHVGGLSILFRCALYGTTVVLHDRFEPEAVAGALDAGEANLVSLVPVQLEAVLDARSAQPFPSSLRAILLGGDSVPEALLERCRALKAPVALTWGMTETASQIATCAPGDLRRGGGSGAPLPFARVATQGGRLTVRGPLACGGDLETRDLGAIDARGRVQVRGRLDDVLVSGGETLSLRELEGVLREHPDVVDAGAVALADPRWGQRPAAALVGRPGRPTPSSEALRAWCLTRLSAPKVPERFEWWTSLPRTELGKLRRAELRRRLEDDASPALATKPQEVRADCDAPVLDALAGVSRQCGAERLAERLEEARAWLGADMLQLDAEIHALAAGLAAEQPAELAARHLLERPGKRLRPFCALLAARMGGRELDDPVRRLAIAAELVHAATLLHDDVIDEGTERRGVATARVVYGNSASVLGGDYLLAESLRLVGGANEPRLGASLIGVISEMVEAEALQLQRRGCLEPDRQAYLRVSSGKTAALFRWVLWGGGTLGGLSADRCAGLGRLGNALGLAYQLVDDVLDLEGEPEETGKDALADLRQGKMTWPVIVATERDPSLAEALAAAAEGDSFERWAGLTARIAETGALDETRAFARAQGQRAIDGLQALPDGWPRQALEAVIQAAVSRTQ